MKAMSAQVSRLVLLVACIAAPLLAAAQSFSFDAPTQPDDEALPGRLKDLALRVLPVYQEANRDRYLASVGALQMALGDPVAARATRTALRERESRNGLGGRAIVDDIYVEARAIESAEGVSFADAYARAFREAVAGLDDLTAYELRAEFVAPLAPRRENLQYALDQSEERFIPLKAAIDLVQAWFEFDAARSYGVLVPALLAEDSDRRYVVEEVTIPVAGDATVAATLVRRRGSEAQAAGRGEPALVEFTLDRASRDAHEAAAHGYASVLARARIAGAAPSRPRGPFEVDGDDARAVVEWVARQPWSNGSVGMQGRRYGGFVAWSAAKLLPPALKAIATIDPMAPGIDVPNANGIFANSAYRWLYALLAAPGDALVNDDEHWRALDDAWYRSGNRYRDFPTLPGRTSSVFRSWLNHPSYDRFWQKWLPIGAEFARIDIPVLTVTGYYSAGQTGALYYFTEHRARDAAAKHSLMIGPFDERALSAGAPPVGGASPYVTAADVSRATYAWFDTVLKGGEPPVLLAGVVNYALAGGSEWLHEPSLAALEQNRLRFYLANSPSGPPHRLATAREAPFSLVDTHDLAERASAAAPAGRGLVLTDLPRAGVSFVTEPLEEPVTLVGRLRGELDFTINKYDVDLELMLYEVRADGAYVKLFDPAYAFRASYTRDRTRRQLLKAGVRERLPFQSERMMGRQLRAGSRLLLTIAVNQRPDQQINYGAGDDVSEESLANAGAAVRIRWHEGTFIEVSAAPLLPAPVARR